MQVDSGLPLQVIQARKMQAMKVAQKTQNLGEMDWGNFFDKLGTNIASIYSASQQRSIAKDQAKYELEIAKLQAQQAQNWGVPLGADMSAMLPPSSLSSTPGWLLPVGIGIAAIAIGYFIIKD